MFRLSFFRISISSLAIISELHHEHINESPNEVNLTARTITFCCVQGTVPVKKWFYNGKTERGGLNEDHLASFEGILSIRNPKAATRTEHLYHTPINTCMTYCECPKMKETDMGTWYISTLHHRCIEAHYILVAYTTY